MNLIPCCLPPGIWRRNLQGHEVFFMLINLEIIYRSYFYNCNHVNILKFNQKIIEILPGQPIDILLLSFGQNKPFCTIQD